MSKQIRRVQFERNEAGKQRTKNQQPAAEV